MIPIVCSSCGEHVFDMRDDHADYLQASDFTPARPEIPAPAPFEEVRCPLCRSTAFIEDLRRAAIA